MGYVYFLCCLMSVGTGFLWWNFYDEYRQRTEFNQTAEFRIPFTSYDMTNERAFLISSIVASVITVRWWLLMCTRITMLLCRSLFSYNNNYNNISSGGLKNSFTSHNLPLTKEEVYVFAGTPALVCLSVCLSVCKITQKRMHGFGWNVACRQTSGHGRTD